MYPLRILDLFSGIGGFSLGLERVTHHDGTPAFRTVAFCEQNDYARRVLNRHWPGVPVYGDVRTLTGAALAAIRPDVVCGGFPCQDISLAGKGAGLDGERSGLWFEMLRIITETRPAWVIAENVAALRSRGLDVVLRGLSEIGYDAEWHCIPASAVGAPHRRDRVWIVAHPKHGGREGRLAGAREEGAIAAMPHGENGPVDHPERERRGAGRDDHAQHDRQQLGAAGQHASVVADAPRQLFNRSGPGTQQAGRPQLADGDWWATEPDVDRVANGVPKRVDRLRCLGNAVVPQIPELIGRAILKTTEVQHA